MTQVFHSPRAGQVHLNVEVPDSLRDLEKRIKRKLPGTIRRIALEGKSFWKTLAGQKLKSSRNAYQKGIDFEIVDDLSFYLTLEGYLPYSVESGRNGFDMKPGFLKGASTHMGRRGPRSRSQKAESAGKAALPTSQYRIIPLNVNRYINMTKPTVFRTVSANSTGWQHPGWKGMQLADEVVKELDTIIIPKHLNKLFQELDKT